MRVTGHMCGWWGGAARVLLVALLSAGCASRSAIPDPAPAAVQEARTYVDSVRRSQTLPAVAATVARNGRVLWSEGLGLADVERGIRATRSTKFRVGSVAKLFTAAALMRMVEGGALALGDSAGQVLTPYPSGWPNVTLRQLASHTAGIRHYRGAEFFSRTEYPSLRDAVAIFAGDSLLFTPGTRYSYSSYGYNLLGALMEGAVGQPFTALMERLVFDPLAMAATVPDSAGRAIADRAALYRVGADGASQTPEDNLSSRWPSGGYLSSTSDMARFGTALLSPGFLSRESLAAMFTPTVLTGGDTVAVGIGWRIGVDSTGRRYLHHGGSSNGGSAFLLIYPDEGLVVAMASNALGSWSTREALRLASFFLPPGSAVTAR